VQGSRPKVISAIAETTWRQQKIRKVLLAPTTFDPCLSRFNGSCRLISELALKLTHALPPTSTSWFVHLCRSRPRGSIETRSLPSSLIATRATFPSTSLIPSAPFTHSYPRQLEPSPARTLLCRSLRWHRCQGEAGRRGLRSMGHNYGRDNARKRAKRRKKHERLASAKQSSRDAVARQGKKAGK
jgi:hypothetical protein